MNGYDFSPLFRSGIGFDRFRGLFENAASLDESSGYPPYNIEKIGEDDYRITMAVAGFDTDELQIESRENLLVISGQRKPEDGHRVYLHRGIAGRTFRRVFQLADYVKVTDAHLDNGLLHVELRREVPEEMKPRRIEIAAAPKGPSRKSLPDEHQKRAA